MEGIDSRHTCKVTSLALKKERQTLRAGFEVLIMFGMKTDGVTDQARP